jgi:ATP-dependent Clp protease ATP-binding subunit ClpB
MTDNFLDVSKLSPEVQKLEDNLLAGVIGQARAIRQIMKAYVPTTVNMHRKARPLGVFLFLGPTGVGKSETVKVFAKQLLGSRDYLTKIDCNEFQEDHEVMKLLGAPPSYVGYNDTPRLAQDKIDQYQKKDVKINIILFDEIEKATPRLFDSILSILGDGGLTLGNGKYADFSRSFIFLTSNLGSHEVRRLIEGAGIGFKISDADRDDLDQRIYRASKTAVEKKFRPEFINRLDKIVVFRSLAESTLRQILRFFFFGRKTATGAKVHSF